MKFKNLLLLLSILLLTASVTVQAQVTGQLPLAPNSIPQFVDPLPHFAGTDPLTGKSIRVDATTATDVYVKTVPHTQVAVSTGTILAPGATGMANLWVYQISTDNSTWTPPLWPAYTIEALRGQPLNVHYSNELFGETYSKVGLVVDPTLHWADPLGNMQPYDAEPPITVHLHGGEVPPMSDGGPDSWFTPGLTPTYKGHSYNPNAYIYPNSQEAATLWFHDHALGVTRLNVYAGMAGFYFLKDITELDPIPANNLKLPGWPGDDLVQEVDPVTGLATTRAPYLPEIEVVIQDRMFDTNGGLYFPNLPVNPEHPVWTPEFIGDVITVNGKTWPYLSVAPRKYRIRLLNGSNARFYNLSFPNGGPTITQIGTDGGFLDAPVALGNGPLLISPGERADIIIDFSPFVPKVKNKKIKYSDFILSNDARTPFPGGAAVNKKTTGSVMQFVVNGTMVDANANGLTQDESLVPASLRAAPLVKLTNFAGAANSAIPAIAKARQLTLNEVMGPGGPLEALVNNTKWSGVFGDNIRPDFEAVPNGIGTDPYHDFTYYSETMDEGTTEIWQIINMTGDAHPIHLHLVQFQLMSRQPFDIVGYTTTYDALFQGSANILDPMTGNPIVDPMTLQPYLPGVFMGGYGPPLAYTPTPQVLHPTFGVTTVGGNPDITPYLLGAALPANANEKGWKDTFIMYPGEVTTVIARWAPTDKAADLDPSLQASGLWFPFDPNGGHGYVWHCHIIDHEDNEMMRPYNVTPSQFNPFVPPSLSANTPVLAKAGMMEVAAEMAEVQALPTEFSLSQNYPNPFNPTTEIPFALPADSYVQLKVYNSVGQHVATLIDGNAPAGFHTVQLDAGNLASGVYFYQITAGSFNQIKKMLLVK